MVKDIPIPKVIFREFQRLVTNKKKLADKFDGFDFSTSLGKQREDKDMPSQIKGQKCLDKYFTKVNVRDSSSCSKEMGKNNISFSSSHNISESDSENEKTIVKPSNKKHQSLSDQEQMSQKFDNDQPLLMKSRVPSTTGSDGLKQGISVNYQCYDSSSNDSGALIIDEEADVESDCPAQNQSPRNDVTIKNATNSEKVASPKKDPTRAVPSSKHDEIQNKLENETLTMSQFLNAPKHTISNEGVNKFSTSTPVDKTSTKKRRIQPSDESEQPVLKKNKTYEYDSENAHSGVNLETMTELVDFDEENCSLFLEDLESDDEIFVVQCPKEVIAEKLVDKKLALNGESLLKLSVNGEKRPYESFSQKDSMGRHVYMILPSRNEKMLKFGMYQLQGSVVISEGIDISEESLSENETVVENEYHHSEIEEQFESTSEKQKKSKKNYGESNSRVKAEENTSASMQHNESVEEEGFDEDMMSTTVIKKKKKKKEKYEESPEHMRFVNNVTVNMKDKEDEEEEVSHKKKKKKKHKSEQDEMKLESITEKEYLLTATNLKREGKRLVEEENYSSPVKKKKKKLDKAADSPEVSVKILEEPSEIKKKKKDKVLEQAIDEQPVIQELLQPKKKKKKYEDNVLMPAPVENIQFIKKEASDSHHRSKRTHGHFAATVDEYRSDSALDEQVERIASSTGEDLSDGIKKKKKKKKKKRESSL